MGNGLKVKRKWGEADEVSKDAGDGGREREVVQIRIGVEGGSHNKGGNL